MIALNFTKHTGDSITVRLNSWFYSLAKSRSLVSNKQKQLVTYSLSVAPGIAMIIKHCKIVSSLLITMPIILTYIVSLSVLYNHRFSITN